MQTTLSLDGTRIAHEQIGQGPALVIVTGAFNDRATGAPLADALKSRFTVYTYDRRGRGGSGDAASYAPEREIEDLAAIVRVAGGSAAVLGYSSGAALALMAAASGLDVSRLALYELPPALPGLHVGELAARIAAGRRGDAVEYFQERIVGIPAPVVAQLRHAPFRPALEALAHTLVYDATLLREGSLSPALLARIRQPVLAIAGAASPAVMRQAAEAVAATLPDGRALVLDGATHDLAPALLGPVLEDFLGAADR